MCEVWIAPTNRLRDVGRGEYDDVAVLLELVQLRQEGVDGPDGVRGLRSGHGSFAGRRQALHLLRLLHGC